MGQTINQVRHLYVADTLKAYTASSAENLTGSEAAGTIMPKGNTAKTELYFQYMSPGGIVRSDLINVDKILYTKTTASGDMQYGLKKYKITLDSNVSATPVAGQEYIIRISFRQYIGLGVEDTYYKYGTVKATAGMTASNFYKEMALSLAKNVFADDYNNLVNIYLNGSTAVTKNTKPSDLSGSYTDITIEEAEQEWHLGMMPQEVLPFEVQPTTIVVDGDEAIWGTVEQVTSTTFIENGHNIADLEYFCMGARGDDYRMMGYPNYIPTKYLVDPDKKYDTLDIHYAFTDSNEGVQKSEKTITIICKDDGSHTDMKALITAINKLLPSDKAITTLS